MSKSKGHRRQWRNSKLPTRQAPTNRPNGTTPKRVKVKHEATQNDHPITGDHSLRTVVPRILTGCAPPTRPAPPHVPAHGEAQPPPSALRKRGADPGSSALAPAPKRPALKRSRSGLALAEVAIARRGKPNEVTFCSVTGQAHPQPAGNMNTNAPDMSKAPESTTGNQSFEFGTHVFKSKYDKGVASPRMARPHTEYTDSKDHGINRNFKVSVGPRALGPQCKACGSSRHMTKDCHVPLKDGTVAICPFHNCSVLDQTDPLNHHLDGLVGFHHSWCMLVNSYELAVRAKDTERIRYMLPQMFGEFVLNRKHKPFCRVVNLQMCPIKIAIEFSREFCQGKMPSGLEEVWPYTKLDTTKAEISEMLKHYDELGWEAMPPGELEAKSWDQIKREYAQGIIPPQISIFQGGQVRRFQQASFKLAAAEVAGKEVNRHDQDSEVKLQAAREGGDDESSAEEEDAAQSTMESNVLLEKLRLLSAKVDGVIERLDAPGGRQTAGEPTIKQNSSPDGTRRNPINIDLNGQSIHWRVE